VHDFTGGITPAGLVWTVRLPDDAVTLAPDGRLLTVDARDLAVTDSTRAGEVPATVSFRMTWKGRGALRKRSTSAFAGRFFRRARSRGTFSATTVDGFAFASKARKPVRSRFAMLGTEQNGIFVAAAARCPRCAAARAGGDGDLRRVDLTAPGAARR